MPRSKLTTSLAILCVLAAGPAAAYDSRFVVTPPPLGQPGFRGQDVQYRFWLAYRGYRSGDTRVSGPILSLQRRQTLSDRFAFSMGATADHLSGTDSIISAEDKITRWQVDGHIVGEFQQRLASHWRAILFAGPKFGLGGYEVKQQDAPGEQLDASTERSGYVVGVQTPLRVDSLRLIPFAAYEELDAHHEVDSSLTGSSSADYTYEVLQYGLEGSLGKSGVTMAVTFREISVGTRRERYTLYQVGYGF